MNRRRLIALMTLFLIGALFFKAPKLAFADDAAEPETVRESSPESDAIVDGVAGVTDTSGSIAPEAPVEEENASADEGRTSQGLSSDGAQASASEHNELEDDANPIGNPQEPVEPTGQECAPKASVEAAGTGVMEPTIVDVHRDTACTTDETSEVSDPTSAAVDGYASALAAQSEGDDTQSGGDDAQSAGDEARAELDKLARDHAGDLPAGRYAIWSNAAPAESGDTARYSLDVRGGSKASGAAIILYKAKVSSNQRWDVAYLPSGYATIRSVASGLYLALKGGSEAYASGAAKVVQQKYEAGALWQQWVIVRQSDGTFKIVSALLKNGTLRRTMDVRGGKAKNSAQSILYELKGSGDGNQRFSIVTTADILNDEARQHKGDIRDGTYLFGSSLKSTYRMNMRRGSMDDRGEAIIYAGGASAVNEGWDIVHTASGYAYIVNSKSGKVLDVRGGKAKNGAAIIQWSKKTNARNQLWICVKESDGSYKFVSALTGGVRYVLGVKGGKAAGGKALDIEQDRGSADKAQHWKASAAPAQYAYAHAVKDGTYVIRTALDRAKVLGVGDFSKKDQAQVRLWSSAQTNNQLWALTHDGQGYVLLKNRYTGLYLAFSKAKVGGTAVTAQSATAGKWIVKPASGAFTLVDGATGQAVHLVAGNTANGAKVVATREYNTNSQRWTFAKGIGKITIPKALQSAFSGVDLTKVKAIGIDVSSWDEDIDWKAVKNAGIQFAILRVGHGTSITDAKITRNVHGCLSAGLRFGVYYYSTARSVTQAKKEASHALSIMKTAGITTSNMAYPIYYDLEESSLESTSNRKLFANMASAFLAPMKKSGYKVGVYANLNWWNNYLTDSSFNNYERWVAQWRTTRCGYKGSYKVWQTRDDGRVPGISGLVDMDVMY